MSYGFELINERNYPISSMDDVNYVLRSSGVIKNSDFPKAIVTGQSSIIMDVSGFSAPIIFFKSQNSLQRFSALPGTGRSQGRLPGTLVEKNTIDVYKWWNAAFSGEVQYYIFDKWIPPERSTYGMQAFDSSGGIIFDSGWNFLRLRNVIWLDPGYPNHSGSEGGSNWVKIGDVAGGGGDVAVAMPTPRFWDLNSGLTGGYRTAECVHLEDNNTSVQLSIVLTATYDIYRPPTGWVSENARSQVMIADVSGLPTRLNPVPITPGVIPDN